MTSHTPVTREEPHPFGEPVLARCRGPASTKAAAPPPAIAHRLRTDAATARSAQQWPPGCYSSTPDAAVRAVPARVLLSCLLFRSSWLTVEGDRHFGAAGVLHRPGARAAVTVRVDVAPSVPMQQRRTVRSRQLRRPQGSPKGKRGERSGEELAPLRELVVEPRHALAFGRFSERFGTWIANA